MKKLSEKEINEVLIKIRGKYLKLISEFNKSDSIMKAFEDRYYNALKNKMDISMFLFAEIEAVGELNKIEEEKELKSQLEKESKKEKSFVEKVFDENIKKIQKYPLVELIQETSEEIQHLFGAIRILIVKYWIIITEIYKEDYSSKNKILLKDLYQKLLSTFDYKGNVPIAKSYLIALQLKPKDDKRIDYEHNLIIKETGFLLNEIMKKLKMISINKSIPFPERILNLSKQNDDWLKKNFDGLTYLQGFQKVIDYIENIINDFRIKEFKRIM